MIASAVSSTPSISASDDERVSLAKDMKSRKKLGPTEALIAYQLKIIEDRRSSKPPGISAFTVSKIAVMKMLLRQFYETSDPLVLHASMMGDFISSKDPERNSRKFAVNWFCNQLSACTPD